MMSQMPEMPSLAVPSEPQDEQDAQEEKTMMSLLLQIQKAKEQEKQSKKRKRAQHEMENIINAFTDENKKQVTELKKRRTHEVKSSLAKLRAGTAECRQLMDDFLDDRRNVQHLLQQKVRGLRECYADLQAELQGIVEEEQHRFSKEADVAANEIHNKINELDRAISEIQRSKPNDKFSRTLQALKNEL